SYIAFISSAENLSKLDHYREINRRLALGVAEPEEASRLAKEGKAIVWIDSGLHASEVAPAQHSPELAFKMLTDDSEEVDRIRKNVILLQVPVINPDGLDMIVHWYRKNVGTPYELAPLPMLYQKYAGHDNNRDWFMLNLQETRNVTRLLFREWFPHIVYNQHQTPAFPARIFVPPYAEPLNPNIPAVVMEGINLIGSTIKERFAREDKTGVLSYFGFDAWWNGGLRSVPAFHNMHGILTETALHSYATPKVYNSSEFPERFANGIPTKQPTVFYQRPWMGGKWGVRDAIEYMLTADMAILDLAATRSSHFLTKSWEMARGNIAAGTRGKPYAYVVPGDQWDRWTAVQMLRRLQMGGVQVQRARAPFMVGTKKYAAGSYVIPAGQPFRSYLVDLLEPQQYPELRAGITGPTKRPYDVAGWTLSMQMGVQVDRAEDTFRADLEPAGDIEPPEPSLDHRDNSSFLRTAALLATGAKVRWSADGTILTESSPAFEAAAYELKKPRVALYEPWMPNMDAGWTQWVLDEFRVPYTLIRNDDFRKGDLHTRFDTIILASQSMASILHGYRDGEPVPRRSGTAEAPALQRPEYTGGIGLAGAATLQLFVRNGGTLVAFDNAGDLPVQLFPLPVRPLLSSSAEREETSSGYYSPGSVIRITVDTKSPIAFGMPAEAFAFQS
ncbi:MAG: peptidase M14, partial [Acidobacteria bacterium]|nr:peptidase M14 [Acidobacteriota bacterium]